MIEPVVTHDHLRMLLPRYAAGTLRPNEVAQVHAHLRTGCSACLDDLYALPVGLPREFPPDPSAPGHDVLTVSIAGDPPNDAPAGSSVAAAPAAPPGRYAAVRPRRERHVAPLAGVPSRRAGASPPLDPPPAAAETGASETTTQRPSSTTHRATALAVVATLIAATWHFGWFRAWFGDVRLVGPARAVEGHRASAISGLADLLAVDGALVSTPLDSTDLSGGRGYAIWNAHGSTVVLVLSGLGQDSTNRYAARVTVAAGTSGPTPFTVSDRGDALVPIRLATSAGRLYHVSVEPADAPAAVSAATPADRAEATVAPPRAAGRSRR